MTLDITKILVPVDFSATSDLALDYALAIARRFDAVLHLVHVCEVPSITARSSDAYAVAYGNWSQQLAAVAERQLVEAEKKLGGVRVSTEVLFGNPARCIVTAADTEGADLIVMGTHGHGPVKHMVMGNVAERVVRHASCPVLTVREPLPREPLWAKANVGAGAEGHSIPRRLS